MVWRLMRLLSVVALLSGSLIISTGCGGNADEDRPDLTSIANGKTDIPNFLDHKTKDWGCGEKLDDKFKGYDSAHSYSFELKKGLRYSFEFSATYHHSRGAALAIYDATSGDRVAVDRNPFSNKAQVTFEPTADGKYIIGVYSVKWTATGDYSLRAVCELKEVGELKPGQTDFVNFEKRMLYRWLAGGNLESATNKSAPSGRTGEVEEADIYKVDKNRLFYLNTYRGFLIFDINNPKDPQLIPRLPVYGYPVEMFVQNNTVYALIRDALYLTQQKGKLVFKRHHVSQLVAIDISSLSNPKVLQRIDIVGNLKEGVSRKIGDTIYVVSHQPKHYYWGWQHQQTEEPTEQAWVYSFNVANPKNLKLVDKLKVFEGGSYNENDPSTNAYKSRNFSKLTLSATSNTLLVVENWRKYGSVYGSNYSCGTYKSQQQAIVSVIDISDTYGKIKLHTSFETYGEVGDQFKQTYVYDQTTGKGYYLGIFARREWQSQNCTGSSHIENNLEAWDVSDGANPTRVDSLSFGKPDETVRGSAFDPDRKVAFAITARNVDPLYAISFSDPKNLKVLSEVDGLSGDMNVFRFIGDKKFLIGIGRDNSAACTGFGDPTTGWAANVAVSVIDVQNLNKIRLVQRKCVTVNDASWVGSQVNWNLDQAHKMIGMHSDGMKNIVSVPVYYTKKVPTSSWYWYRRETAVGLMSWDLTQYDPQLSELNQKVLTNHGTIVHTEGQVRRSIVFTHKGINSSRKMINLSNTHMSVVDIEDLNKPVTESEFEIAPYYNGLYRFGNYMVEQVGRSWGYDKPAEFRVKKIASGLDAAKPVASFSVDGYVQRVVPFKDNLVIFRRLQQTTTSTAPKTVDALVYSLATPQKPVQVGSVKVPISYIPCMRYRCGVPSYYFQGSNSLTVTDRAIVMMKQDWSPTLNSSTTSLVFVDLNNPAAPTVSEQPLTTDADTTYLDLVLDDSAKNSFYLNSRKQLDVVKFEGTEFDKVKYYATRFKFSSSSSSWKQGTPVNVPGLLMRSWSNWSTKHFLTHDKTFELVKNGGWRESTRLNLLMPTSSVLLPKAVLFDSHRFSGYTMRDVVVDGNVLYINATEHVPYSPGPIMPMGGIWQPYTPGEDKLMIFKISFFKLNKVFTESLGTEYVQLMGAYKGQLFLNLPSDGILVVNATNPSKPYGQQFLRTLGWASQVEFAGNTAYVPSGYYGIYELNLKGAPLLTLE